MHNTGLSGWNLESTMGVKCSLTVQDVELPGLALAHSISTAHSGHGAARHHLNPIPHEPKSCLHPTPQERSRVTCPGLSGPDQAALRAATSWTWLDAAGRGGPCKRGWPESSFVPAPGKADSWIWFWRCPWILYLHLVV